MHSANSTNQQFNDLTIIIANRQRVKKIDSRLLKEIASAILAELEIEHCELEINLLGTREMAAINETFLGHEGSTDVITFDYSEGKKLRRNVGVSGEIFISVDDAIAQAKKFKTKWQSEIVRYIVHGILHLLGHDDLKPQLRSKMKREENLLLRKLSKKFPLAEIGGGSKLRA
ncbi:MAG TPA: rRNA maturation RNase YbeY [Verrucomicrobiae bacterium]|jgi:probable rRNA maturation factor